MEHVAVKIKLVVNIRIMENVVIKVKNVKMGIAQEINTFYLTANFSKYTNDT